MSTAKTQFDQLVATNEQEARVIEARARLRNIYHKTIEVNARIKELSDAGDLNTIPAQLLSGLNKVWTAFKTCQASIEALAEKDLLD
jgi:hypothetical protein